MNLLTVPSYSVVQADKSLVVLYGTEHGKVQLFSNTLKGEPLPSPYPAEPTSTPQGKPGKEVTAASAKLKNKRKLPNRDFPVFEIEAPQATPARWITK